VALRDETGARGLAGDLFVDGGPSAHAPRVAARALHGRAAHLRQTPTSTPMPVEAHLSACTEAGITAGLPRDRRCGGEHGGRRVGPGGRGRFGAARGRAVRPPTGTPGDGDRRPGKPTRSRWGWWRACSPTSMPPGVATTACTRKRLGADRARPLNPFAPVSLSQGVPLAFGSDSPVTSIDSVAYRGSAAMRHADHGQRRGRPGRPSRPRPAGAWRAAGVRDGVTGTLAPGAPASYVVVGRFRGARGPRGSPRPADTVQRWSTDPRSRVPRVPRLECRRSATDVPPGRCTEVRSFMVDRRRRREFLRRTMTPETLPVVRDTGRTVTPVSTCTSTPSRSRSPSRTSPRSRPPTSSRTSETEVPPSGPTFASRYRQPGSGRRWSRGRCAMVHRGRRRSVCCASAFRRFGLVVPCRSSSLSGCCWAWVCSTRPGHQALPAGSATDSCSAWPSTFRCCRGSGGLVGAISVAGAGVDGGRCSPRCSGSPRSTVRRTAGLARCGCAGLWGIVRMAEVDQCPFGGFPWGVVGFSQG